MRGNSHLEHSSNIQGAVHVLSRGELVILPTETVYGIAADATSNDACRAIFEAKGRPQNNPLIVHCSDIAHALRCFRRDTSDEINAYENARMLLQRWSPGPLTVIAYANDYICDIARASGDTVAVRIPDHTIFLSIVRTCKKPLAAPSANISGRPSATTAEHARNAFLHSNFFVVDGGMCAIGLESTIVDCTQSVPHVVRPGAVRASDIASLYAQKTLISGDDRASSKKSLKRKTITPGSVYAHYKPQCTVIAVERNFYDYNVDTRIMVQNITKNQAMRICKKCEGHHSMYEKNSDYSTTEQWKVYYEYETWDDIARALYDLFLHAEKLHCNIILIDMPTEDEHEALRDRITRACADMHE